MSELKIVTSFSTLMSLAREEGQAKLHGTKEEYEQAKQKHEAYKELCLKSDKVILGQAIGGLATR